VTKQQIYQWVPRIQKHFDDSMVSIKATTNTAINLTTATNKTTKTTTTTTTTASTIPKHCLPSEELERLLQKSLEMERDVLSRPWYNHFQQKSQSTMNGSLNDDRKHHQHNHQEQEEKKEEVFRRAFANYVKQEKIL
jgi:hypothetical protein